jgi:hypothetical protein
MISSSRRPTSMSGLNLALDRSKKMCPRAPNGLKVVQT